jgi:hypothetical protein
MYFVNLVICAVLKDKNLFSRTFGSIFYESVREFLH